MKLVVAIVLIGLLAAWSGQTRPAQAQEDTEEAATEPERIESQEASWELGLTRVYATLTRPTGQGPYPAMILVAGSGPTDRDWNSPLLPGQNGSGRLLAEALSEAGYLTLRYDKRFCGPHASENLDHLLGKISFQSHIDELAGAMAFLAARPEVDPARIFALANSEGGIHALNYQRQAGARRFAGLILTGLPGRTIAVLMRAQVGAQLTGLPDGQTLISLFDQAVGDFMAGRPVSPDERLPQGLRQLIQSLTAPANLPFTRELMAADAARLLTKDSGPILIIIGQKDIQVDWRADGGPLEAAAAGRDEVVFNYPPNADHVLKRQEKPRQDLGPADALGHNAPGRVIDPQVMEAILEWLAARTGE